MTGTVHIEGKLVSRDVTAAGYPILMQKLSQDGEDGIGVRGWGTGVRGWIGLVDISDHNSLHPFATWFMREDGLTFSGDYCKTYKEAVDSFTRRR